MWKLAPLPLLSLGLAAASPALAAESQSLRYTLEVGDQAVGYREVKVTWLPADASEVRIIESFTDLTVSLAGRPYHWSQRMAGRGGQGGFSSVLYENGRIREVQAALAPDGWRVSVAEGTKADVYELDRDAFDATSLLLIDPGYPEALAGRSQLKVLLAETGGVVDGGLRAAGAAKVTIGGQALSATEYVWATPEAEVRLAYGEHGHLLRYTMVVAGQTVTARLDAPPPERSYGSALDGPLIGVGGPVGQQDL